MNPKIFQSTPPKKNRWPNLFLRRKSQQKLLLFGATSLDIYPPTKIQRSHFSEHPFIQHCTKNFIMFTLQDHQGLIYTIPGSQMLRTWLTRPHDDNMIYIYRDIHECIHICTSISDIPWVKKNDEEFSTKWIQIPPFVQNPPIC